MALIKETTPQKDGFRMPAEYEKQNRIWIIWPEREDVWRDGAIPAQKAYADVAVAISEFENVTMIVSDEQYENCRKNLPEKISVIKMPNNDAWCRDMGPAFVTNEKGELRAVDWKFNAWGGNYDGLYSDWSKDDKIAEKMADYIGIDRYRTEDFVLEGGSICVDGEGTVMTTKMCLLSKGRNPSLNMADIEKKLCEYLNCKKVLWVPDGIDPDETNGHIDDVACFIKPGEVACIYTDDINHPFYEAAQKAYEYLSQAVDAKGRRLKVHKLCCPKKNVTIKESFEYKKREDSKIREAGDVCIASYANFLIVNGGVIVPQYDDENDVLAIEQIKKMFPERKVVGVKTREIVYGGGNIHCITMQEPAI